jgi:outer membrane protein insertion porin family
MLTWRSSPPYYRGLGYFRARIGREIELDDSGRRAKLRFVIDEGPRYIVRNVSLVGNKKFATDSLQSDLNSKPGEYFNQAKMNRDVAKPKEHSYGGEGHIFADVQADPRGSSKNPENSIWSIASKRATCSALGKIDVKIDGEFPDTPAKRRHEPDFAPPRRHPGCPRTAPQRTAAESLPIVRNRPFQGLAAGTRRRRSPTAARRRRQRRRTT